MTQAHQTLWASPDVRQLRDDLALALRAADHHQLAEGICNHFSVSLPDIPDRYLINPLGLHWSEIGPDDIVMIDGEGTVLHGHHRVETTAMHIHAAAHQITGHAVVLHTHMPYATALTLTVDGGLDVTLSQNAMRFLGRTAIDYAYNGLALSRAEGDRIARSMQGKDIAFLANHGIIVAGPTLAWAYDDLYYLERACQHQVLAMSTGRPLAPVNAAMAKQVAEQIQGERGQSDLFFEALRRIVPPPVQSARAATTKAA